MEILKDIFSILTPIIVALIGFQGVRTEKQTKKLVEAQEALNKAKDEIKEKESKELDGHFSKLEQSIQSDRKSVV